MSESRSDSDRAVLATTIMVAVISVVMYFIVYLTLLQYQMLNDDGRTFAVVALVLSALAMLLACYLTLTQRGQARWPRRHERVGLGADLRWSDRWRAGSGA